MHINIILYYDKTGPYCSSHILRHHSICVKIEGGSWSDNREYGMRYKFGIKYGSNDEPTQNSTGSRPARSNSDRT